MAVPLRLRLFSTRKFGKPVYTMATADVDGDGKEEIIVGVGDGKIQILKYETGDFEEVWSDKMLQWVDQIVIADIDQDVIEEIFLVTGRLLTVYKFRQNSYKQVWNYQAEFPITSICVGDSNNNRQNELLIGCNDGSLFIFAQKDEEPFNFKQVWKRKLEGDVLISIGDVDADTLNEIVVASNNIIRVYRVVDKYPKKESWTEEFKNYIKRIRLFDLNSDKKAEIFLGMEDGNLRIFSHKDGNYFSEDKSYSFKSLISTISSGTIHEKDLIIAGSYDKTLRAFKADTELFQIELDEKIYSSQLADIIHDGKPELLCASGNNIYIFKEDVTLSIQMDHPNSLFCDEELLINYYIKNNSEKRVYNLDFSNLDWTPKILTMQGSRPKIPFLEKSGAIDLSFRFNFPTISKVTQIIFPSFKLHFEMNNRQHSQTLSEITIKLLPTFSDIARSILKRLERLKGTKIPLNSLAKLMEKDLGSLEFDIDRITSRLVEEKWIKGTLTNRVLTIRDITPHPDEIPTLTQLETEQKLLSPELFMNALKKTVKRKKRTSLYELGQQFSRDSQEIEVALKKLKENHEITGFLIPNEEFIYLTPEEIDSLVDKINETPYITLLNIEEEFDLTEPELKFLLNDLVGVGKLFGELRTKDGVTRFITTKALSETLQTSLQKNGKITIKVYARNNNLSIESVREALRSLLDSRTIQGHYTFNGAVFYTDSELEKELITFIEASEITSIGLNSIAKQFQISKEGISLVLNNLINTNKIQGYISENTFFKRSYEEEKLRDIYEKYRDALNLIHILIIHKESGVALFSESYTTEKIEPLLVSGFLQAITSFGSEISGLEGSIRHLEYKEFKISVDESELIRAALILKEEPSQRLLEILKHFIRFFDTNYRDALINFKGLLEPFSDAGDLINDFFETSLSFPHEIQEKLVF
ncbi:MAG: FG-GAP-like repeat-containing protein, partial [Promethearchaeota archaeon]